MLRVMISPTVRTIRMTILICVWILRIACVVLKVCARLVRASPPLGLGRCQTISYGRAGPVRPPREPNEPD